MIEAIDQTPMWVFPVATILVFLPFFLMSPVSNVLNVVTRPLGYEYSSCPYCPDFGLQKIEYEHCDNCGQEHGRGFSGAAAYRDGDKYVFCSNDCLDAWNERRETA